MPKTPRNAQDLPQTDLPKEEAIQEILRRIEQEILRRIEEELHRGLTVGGQTLDQIEEQSQTIGEAVKRIIEEKTLGCEGTGYSGTSLPCERGHRARYAGLRSRQLITCSGTQWLRRAYYYCAVCRRGECPVDRTLDIGRGQCSRRVQTWIARFSSYLPDQQLSAGSNGGPGARSDLRS